MPIHSCKLPGGGSGYKYGNKGHCYPSREAALKQMRAMFHNGYTGGEAELDKFIEALAESNIQSVKLPKSNFDRKSAKAWAEEHGFNNEFITITEDYIVMSQFPAKTNAGFASLEASDGVILKVEGDVTSVHNLYMEAVKLATKDRTEVSTETKRMTDTNKPQTAHPAEQEFLFDKRRFTKESAQVWFRHYMSKKYGMVKENENVSLVEKGEFWSYECVSKDGFSKFKTVDYGHGVTCILAIV